MASDDEGRWARERATLEGIAWAMDLGEEERGALVSSMPREGWSHEEQSRFASLLVAIADREELGLPNPYLELFPGRRITGVPEESIPLMTLPDILSEPAERLVGELNELTVEATALATRSEYVFARIGVLLVALSILRDPDPPTSS
jgi:hypothetical protein